jgi:hypothetical protein
MPAILFVWLLLQFFPHPAVLDDRRIPCHKFFCGTIRGCFRFLGDDNAFILAFNDPVAKLSKP